MKTNILISLLAVTMFVSLGYNFAYHVIEEKINRNSIAKCELKTQMNRFWEDHVIWIRHVALNVIDDLPGTNIAIERLFKTQSEIGRIIKPYYGKQTSDRLTILFHVSAIHTLQMLKAIKTTNVNNTKNLEQISTAWKKNADDIALLLSHTNPNWKLSVLKRMLYHQITQITSLGLARKNKYYVSDVAFYDKLRKDVHEISDTLTLGIVKHFPLKFKGVQKN